VSTSEPDNQSEAEGYHSKALLILHELQANIKIYGANSPSISAPADVDLALQYIDRSLELYPDNAVYLNLKALLVWEGKENKEDAAILLEKAVEISPRDIDIQNNLTKIKLDASGINSQNEATQYHLKAKLILDELHANIEVHGSNTSILSEPADVDLALQYIDRSLELFPDNAIYLNDKALLVWEGKGDNDAATTLLEKAVEISPRDIDIQNNLSKIKSDQVKSSSCFIATAAFGSPLAKEVYVFRTWRDEALFQSFSGRTFVKVYYVISPPVAAFISKHPSLRNLTRSLLTFLVKRIERKHNYGP